MLELLAGFVAGAVIGGSVMLVLSKRGNSVVNTIGDEEARLAQVILDRLKRNTPPPDGPSGGA